ncbi:MAG: Hpt domain-containing protein [Mariprofundaceae bacterium]
MSFDLETALKGMGNDESLLYETLQDFIDYYGDAGEKIRIALNEERYADAEILSHTLKGLGGTFASQALSDSGRSLENAIRKRDLDGLDEKVNLLDKDIHEMVAEIRQLLTA